MNDSNPSNAFITNLAVPVGPDGEAVLDTSKDITLSSNKMVSKLDASRASKNQVNFNNSVTEDIEDSNSEDDEE